MSANRRSSIQRNGSGTLLREILPSPPIPLTSFIGRAQELADLERLLPASRLLTLTGPGGIGKSRLAMEIARSVEARGGVDACFIDLALISDPVLVPQTVASALGLREQRDRSYVEQVVEALRHHPMLMVLDNCEHLVFECAQLVSHLLAACPSLTVLATSRASLGIAGERVWAVPPLSMPSVDATAPTADQIERSEAGMLFLERARLRHAGLELTPDDAAHVATICRRLDGLPLALELAAARTAVLAPGQIVERLEDRFVLLTGGGQLAPPRHRTLRALVDWSYGLLSDAEQALLRRVSVFAGSWDIAAMEAVGGGGDIEGADTLDLLQRLIDQSLVVVETGAHGRRYRLLETIQEYARERLHEAGEELRIRELHALWYLRLAEQGGCELWGPQHKLWCSRLDADLSNLREAITWCVDRARQTADTGEVDADGEVDTPGNIALRVGGALMRFWELRGYLSEARRLLTAILETDSRPSPARVDALNAFGSVVALLGDVATARKCLGETSALAREIGYPPGLYLSTVLRGAVATRQGEYEDAAGILAEADRMVVGIEESLARYIGQVIGGWVASIVFQARGDFEQASEVLAASYALALESRDQATQGHMLTAMGNLAFMRGDAADSASKQRAALIIQRDLGALGGTATAHALEGLACAIGAAGKHERAARLFGGAEGLTEAAGLSEHKIAAWQSMNAPVIRTLREALGDKQFAERWVEGKRAGLHTIFEWALTAGEDSGRAERAPAPTAGGTREAASSPLTAREREVAALIARGYTNRQIANELVITERTAETHTRHIREKLGFTSRTQVAAWAIEHGVSRPT